MTDEQKIKMLEETRLRDINAMLLAIILINRGQPNDAVSVLIERLPEDISGRIKARANG